MFSWYNKSKNKNVSKFCDKWPASFMNVKPDFINDLFLVFHETTNQIEAADSLPLVHDALWWFLCEVQQCLNDSKHQHGNITLFFYSLQKTITAGSSSQTSQPRRAAAHAQFPFNEADPETKLGGMEVKRKQVPLLGLTVFKGQSSDAAKQTNQSKKLRSAKTV